MPPARSFKRTNRGRFQSKRFEQEKFMPGSYGSRKPSERTYPTDRGRWIVDEHEGQRKHNDTPFALFDPSGDEAATPESEFDSDNGFVVSDGYLSDGEGVLSSSSETASDEEEVKHAQPPRKKRKRIVHSSEDECDSADEDNEERLGEITKMRNGWFMCRYHLPSAPQSEEPAPQSDESAPEHEESAQEHDESAPEHEEPAPEHEESAPEQEEPAPEQEEPAPQSEEPAQEHDEDVTAQDSAPQPSAFSFHSDPFSALYSKEHHMQNAKSAIQALIRETFDREQAMCIDGVMTDVMSIRNRRDKLVQVLSMLSSI